jgi:Flp pilus assembly protein TadG
MVSTSNKARLLGFFGCRAPGGAGNRVRRLITDKRGVAAIEFAFVAPLLLMTYLASMEISLAIEASKKVSRAASMVADLIAQQPTMTKAEIEAIMAIGGSLLQPYNRSGLTLTVTAIAITNEATPQVKVAWSRKLEKGEPKAGVAAGTATTVPQKLKIAGSFLVRVESVLDYKPVIAWSDSQKASLGLVAAIGEMTMTDTYHLRPRMSQTIPCSDCYN